MIADSRKLNLDIIELQNYAYHIPSILSDIGRVALGTRRDIVSGLNPCATEGIKYQIQI